MESEREKVFMERWLFGCFLMAAAMQDWKRKQVDVWIYLLFGSLSLVLLFYRILSGEDVKWIELVGSGCIGLGMLGFGIISYGGIGSGDGCFFLISSLMIGFWENLVLLYCGTMLCGVFSLGYWAWCRWHTVEHAGKRVIPFLPFLVPPGIWLVFCGHGW